METIVCAAIWYKELPSQKQLPINILDGVVICGLRHAHCIDILHSLTGIRSVDSGPNSAGETVQGFLTNHNRFVDRLEGFHIASRANQILKKHPPYSELLSEDLY